MENRWKEMYKSKLKTPDEAVAEIRDGEGIGFSLANGRPEAFCNALAKRVLAGELSNIKVFAGLGLSPTLLNSPEIVDKVEFDCPYLGPIERFFVQKGLYTYTPVKLGDADLIARRNLRPGSVMAMTVSPMDRNGFFSCGINVDYGYGLARMHPGKRLLILEVNEHMPRTFGVNLFHISEVDVIIENNVPLKTLPEVKVTEEDRRIAEYIVEHIRRFRIHQIGLNVGYFMIRKTSIHTEMITDSMLDLGSVERLPAGRRISFPTSGWHPSLLVRRGFMILSMKTR